MSGKLTAIDPAEIEKFKERFAAGRAKQIEDANNAAIKLGAEATVIEDTIPGLEDTATTASRNWKNKEGLRLKKAKPGDPSAPELKLKVESEAADLARDTAKTDLAEAVKARDVALKLADKMPREGYQDKYKAIIARLEGTGVTIGALDKTAVSDIKALLDKRDYDGADTRLANIEEAVRGAVAARDVPVKHAALAARLATLDKQTAKDPGALKQMDTLLKSVDPTAPTGKGLAKLEGEIETAMAELEKRIQAILDLTLPLDGAINLLERGKPSDALAVADHRLELNKCVNVAKAQPEKALARLIELDKAVKATQQNRKDEASAALEYPGELAALQQRIKDFPTLSASHKSRGNAVTQKTKSLPRAIKFALENEFVVARRLLAEMDDEIDTLDEAADEQEEEIAEKLDAQAAAAAKALKDKIAKAAKAAQDKIAQEAADAALVELNSKKAALTLESLDLIGKDSDFDTWMDKVKALRTAKLLKLSIPSATYWLNGNTTVEVEIDIDGVVDTAFGDRFVVHYHPASVWDGMGSKIHSKPYTGNMATPKDRRLKDTGHWLFGAGVPSLDSVEKNPPP